ncbi:MAG: TMEM175 family protein [Pyrinomonadaceae bacterium]
MNKTRLEAFSDAVIAILMTIMVLELKVPHGETFDALRQLFAVFLAYILSFVYLGIYWNNHHHMLQAARKVNGKILWANMHLLFWLSLVPFATGWMGENHFAAMPTALYGVVLLMCALAYTILQTTFVKHHTDEENLLAKSVGKDLKGKISLVCYLLAIGFSFVQENISHALYVIVALIWLVPDRRIERNLEH